MTDAYQPGWTAYPPSFTPQPPPSPQPSGGTPTGVGSDDWESYGASAFPQKETKPAAPQAQGSDDWENYGASEFPKPKERQEISPTQAFGAGVTNIFGAGPAIAGLAEASGIDEPNLYESVDSPIEVAKRAGTYVMRPFVGLGKIAHHYITSSGDQSTIDAYNRGRQASLDYNDEAFKQDPKSYLLGQLVQAAGIPLSGGAAALGEAGAIGRTIGAMRAGGVGGGLYGAGESTSRGQSPGDIAINTALGAGEGMIGGAGLQGLFEGVGKTAGRIGMLTRGKKTPAGEAERMLTEGFSSDKANPRTPQITPQQQNIGKAAGLPLVAADVGGPEVHGLADWAARHSPDAKWAIQKFAGERFEGQGPRMAALMRGIIPKPADMEVLKKQARAVTKPLYDRAYAVGQTVPVTPELARLSNSPGVQEAIQKALSKWKDWQIADGYGGLNPGITFKNGLLEFKRGGGVPTHSDLRFWDLVHRELSGGIGEAVRRGDDASVRRLAPIHSDLMRELDKLVPEFANARQTHALFKRGEMAYETGSEWVTNSPSIRDARKYLASLKPVERELLAHGFAQSFIDKMERISDRQQILNRVRKTENARQLMDMALGPGRANIVEAGLRLEEIVDRLRGAGGGSPTTLGLAESARHTGGAVAAIEGMKEEGIHPVGMLMAALGWSALKKHAAGVDERIASELAQMLLSGDPDKFATAVKRIGASAVMREAVRRFGEAGTRTAIGNVGPRNIASGATAYITHEKEQHRPNPNEDLLAGPLQ